MTTPRRNASGGCCHRKGREVASSPACQQTDERRSDLLLTKSGEQWHQDLTPADYQIHRLAGTERPGVGDHTDTKTPGVCSCCACNTEPFRSDTSSTATAAGPASAAPLAQDRVDYIADLSVGAERVEVRSLWEAVMPAEVLRLPEELARVDALLDDPVFFVPFLPFLDPRVGQPSTPMETTCQRCFRSSATAWVRSLVS